MIIVQGLPCFARLVSQTLSHGDTSACGQLWPSKDLDEKEKQLEEHQNRVQSLSNVLAKQQNVSGTEM